MADSRSQDSASLDLTHLWHPFTPMHLWLEDDPLVIERADGCWLYDTDGNRYLDANSSLWVNVHGHRRTELDDALRAQLDKAAHTTTLGLSNPAVAALAARLKDVVPAGLERVFFSESGASAVEVALKLAFGYWRNIGQEQRTLFVSMDGAYHGDTLGAVSVGHMDDFHDKYRPLLFATDSFAQPYCYRCPLGLAYPGCELACADTLDDVLARHGDTVAAVIVEPLVQGAAGIITAPDGHLSRVAEITRRHGTLLIVDEVATGFGRTGAMFASQLEGVSPDLMAIGKGLTGGYLPMSATLTTAAIFDAYLAAGDTFFHGHSYSGNPLTAAVALASLELFATEDTVGKARALADVLAGELKALADLPHVGDVRQRGIMAGVELVADRTQRTPYDPARRTGAAVCARARELGVVIRPLGDTIVVMPAPVMKPDELRFLVSALRQAIIDVTEGAA